MKPRKNIVIHEEDFASLTIMKPFSDGYHNHLIVVHEDAYGEMNARLTTHNDLKIRLSLTDEEFDEMMKKL